MKKRILFLLCGIVCAAYETLAEKLGVRFVNAGAWDIELCYDGVHFTEKGHESFAAGMAEYLDEMDIRR